MKNHTPVSLAAMAAFVMTSQVHASITTEDAFAVPPYSASALNGQTASATGASGTWTANADYSVSATNLPLAGLFNSGGRVDLALNPTGGATTWCTAVQSMSNPGTGTTYLSFVVRSDRAASIRLGFGANNSRVIGTSEGLFIAGASTGGTFNANTTYLLIAKIEHNAIGVDERITLWTVQNGTLVPATEVDAGAFTAQGQSNIITTGGAWQPNAGWYYSNNDAVATAAASLDELRIGTTWEDVVPTVEQNLNSIDDSFPTGGSDYAAGDLNGQNPVRVGATTAWVASTDYDISTSGLSFPGLTTAGGSVQTAVNPTAGAYLTAVQTMPNPGTGVTYLSFLMRSDRAANLRLGFGANGSRAIGTSGGSFIAGATTGGSFAVDTTYLMIAKIEHNFSGIDERISVWALPSGSPVPASEVAAGTITVQGLSNIIQTSGAWQPNAGWYYSNDHASATATASFDELRIGSRWSDVVPSSGTPPSPYDNWADDFPGFTPTDAGLDFDNDGLSNLLEFVLGGNPTLSESGISPSVTTDGTDLVLTFKRSDASELAPAVAVKVQVSTDLSTWNPADDILVGTDTPSSDPEVLIDEDGANPDIITVTIPKGVDLKKFARVVATQ